MPHENRQQMRLKPHHSRRLEALAESCQVPKTVFLATLFDRLTDADFVKILDGQGAPDDLKPAAQSGHQQAGLNIDAQVSQALAKALQEQIPAVSRSLATQLEIMAAPRLLNAISAEINKAFDNKE